MAKLTLFYKGRAIKTLVVDKERLTIGRKQNCDMIIDSMAVEPVHAIISQSGNQHFIKPSSASEQLIVNHNTIDTPHTLTHGDVIQIGQYTLSFAESAVTLNFEKSTHQSEKKPEPVVAQNNTDADPLDQLVGSLNVLPRSCLQVISGEHLGKTIPLHRALLRLGLSGNQCAIIAHRSDGYYLSHLEGECLPVVDGEQVMDKSILLQDGSVIQIGDIRLRFHEEIAKAAAI